MPVKHLKELREMTVIPNGSPKQHQIGSTLASRLDLAYKNAIEQRSKEEEELKTQYRVGKYIFRSLLFSVVFSYSYVDFLGRLFWHLR